MSKTFKILFLFLLINGILAFGLTISGLPIWAQLSDKISDIVPTERVFTASPEERFRKTDSSGNKIFDDLEERIKPASTEGRFDVIVVLNRPLDVLSELKEVVGVFEETFTYPAINGFAANLTKGQITALAQKIEVRHVEYDAPVFPHLDASQQWFGTTKARADFAVDGNLDGQATFSKDDAVIAILDTGIDPDHIDITPDKIIGWKDIMNNQPSSYDETNKCGGHGTHVSSIAAGLGAANPDFAGVAPGAALVGIKVLAEFTTSPPQPQDVCSASESQVVAGVQWMIDNKAAYGINIGNMSLGVSGCSDGTDALSQVVNAAVDAGITMFVSAGNEGPGTCTIGSPAAAAKAVTVGAMADITPYSSGASAGCGALPYRGFYQACFSSRGLTADNRMKPDISSPGVFITAAEAGTTNGYVAMSGTSMSSPFTAGLAALILQADPNLTPAQTQSIIESTSEDWGVAGKDKDYGAGRLQGYEAVKTAGSFSGTNVATPQHIFLEGSVPQGGFSEHVIEIQNASYPVAATMIIGQGQGTNPDLDLEVRDADGNPLFSCSGSPGSTAPCPCTFDSTGICKSRSTKRQETIGFQPPAPGTYILRVVPWSTSFGDYKIDLSAGTAPAVAISLTTDGLVDFGIVALGETVDSSGDVQTVGVDTGPANLDVKSTVFCDNENCWSLADTNGPNQMKWEFSPDAGTWDTFLAADTLYDLADNVAEGGTQDLFLKITMPTETDSTNQYSSTVTIVATSP